jgi:hypothetical protein
MPLKNILTKRRRGGNLDKTESKVDDQVKTQFINGLCNMEKKVS